MGGKGFHAGIDNLIYNWDEYTFTLIHIDPQQ